MMNLFAKFFISTNLIFTVLAPSVFSAQAIAAAGGGSVGNGGVIWACRSGLGGRNFHDGILSDLFEAQQQPGWTLIQDPGGDPMVAYQVRKTWLKNELPDLFTALEKRFEYVEQHLTFVNAELLSTKDFNNWVKPEALSCALGVWEPLNIANFREEDQQVLISSALWNSANLKTLDKAALLFHEAIYYWMRTYYGSTNSDKARKITGVLFTTLPTDRMKEEIRKVLGQYPDRPEGKFVCVLKNSKRNQVYVAYDADQNSTALSVRMRCQQDADAQWCQRSSLQCEEVIAIRPQQMCVAENSSTRKLYTGRGRNLLEAQFNAHMACYVGSQAQGSMEQLCPDFSFMECD